MACCMHSWTVTATRLDTYTGWDQEWSFWCSYLSHQGVRPQLITTDIHLLNYNSLCNIHHLLSVMIWVSEASYYSHSTIMPCTETVYWPELDSATLTQICFAKALEASQRHSFFCFWSALLWDAWTGSQSGWSVCLEICCPVSQSTDSQMGGIINDSSHQERNSSSPEHGYSCAAPKGGCCPCSLRMIFILSNLGLFDSSILFTHQSW